MRKARWLMSLVLALGLWFSLAAEASQLKVGTARVEIVIPKGIPLSGYGSRVTKGNVGVHDPVFARAMILESEGRRAGVICADILMMQKDIRDDVLARVRDLGLEFLSISATHTHYSLGAYINDRMAEIAVMGKYDPKAREILITALEKSLREAAKELVPVKVGAGEGPSPGVTANRRHPGGPTDPSLRVLGMWTEEGKLKVVILNHAIHPTVLPPDTRLVSGDVAGRAESWLEEKYPGVVAMFMNAGLGDQRPLDEWTVKSGTWESMDRIGVALAKAADEVLSRLAPSAEVKLTLYRRTFKLPAPYLRNAPECWYGLAPVVKKLGMGMVRSEGELMGLGLNQALFLFSPAEISYEVQAHLQAMFPDRVVFVVTHSNDWYGYVITPQDYDTGGYESCMNLYGRDFAPLLEQEFKAMVTQDPAALPQASGCGCGG